jgi:biopolymer transport protein ExbD
MVTWKANLHKAAINSGGENRMKIKALLLVLTMLIGFSSAQAQKKKRPLKKSASSSPATSINEASRREDYVFTVEIDKDSKIKLAVQKSTGSEFLGDTQTTYLLTDFLAKFSNRKPAEKLNSAIIVKPHPVLKYEEVVSVVKKISSLAMQTIKVEISEDFYVYVPPEMTKKEKTNVKPNPFILIVELDKSMKLRLNEYEMGSLNDLSRLERELKQIFRDRDANGVYRSGTNEIEKRIFLKAPPAVGFFDVIKIIESLRKTGAAPIGLAIDDVNLSEAGHYWDLEF